MSEPDTFDIRATISPVSFGAMTFGDQVDTDDEARRMVDACLDAGITMFDTANSYTGGMSERMLGRVIAPHRDDVVIATKVGNPVGDGPTDSGLSRASIVSSIDDSLRRLGTDRIDLFYFHLPDGSVPLGESLEAVNELAEQGKIRAFGVSNYPAWEICEQLWIAERDGFIPPTVVQSMYNLIARRIEDEYVGFAEHVGLATVIFNPLAGGLLTGKHRPGGEVTEGRFSNPRYRARYWNEEQFEAVEALSTIAEEAGTDLRDLALRWVLAQPVVTSVLVGASRFSQLEENLASLGRPPLDAEVMARCDEVWSSLRGVAPRYDKTRMKKNSTDN